MLFNCIWQGVSSATYNSWSVLDQVVWVFLDEEGELAPTFSWDVKPWNGRAVAWLDWEEEGWTGNCWLGKAPSKAWDVLKTKTLPRWAGVRCSFWRQSSTMGSQRIGHNWETNTHAMFFSFISCYLYEIFCEMSVQDFCPFFDLTSYCWFVEILYILRIWDFYISIYYIFSSVCALNIHFLSDGSDLTWSLY